MLTEQQVIATNHIQSCVEHYQPPEKFSVQEALRQLLHTARYAEGAGDGVGHVAPFGAGPASLPAFSLAAPAVADLLGEDGDTFRRFETCMMRSDEEYLRHIEEKGTPKIYVDPKLKEHRGQYEELAAQLLRLGMLGLCNEAKEHVGLFLAWKKDRSLRLICDARRANARFREPPDVKLATGDSLSDCRCREENRCRRAAWT